MRAKQQGTAIIVALFLVGLVAVIAITMMERLNRDMRRTELLLHSIQADLYAQGSVIWAIDTLRYHWLNQKKNQLIDNLPQSSPVNIVNHYRISSTIYDAQAGFNLNNLSTDESAIYFQRLLLLVDPQLESEKAQKITASLMNWLSPVTKNINEDLYYTKLPQPYRAAHRPMASVSELRLIQGVTPQLYLRLLPYLTALPEKTAINVNTAAIPVLQSLSPTLTTDSAKAIEAYRKQMPFDSVDKFLNMDIVRNNNVPSDKLTVSSQYFLIKTQVEKNEQQLILYTLVQRISQNNKAIVRILWQTKGAL